MTGLTFSDRNRELFDQLQTIDPSINAVMQGMVAEIYRFEPSLLDEWKAEGLWPKIEAHVLRYVLPMYELLRAGDKRDVIQPLVVQLFSCVAWRHFDNCVDGHGPVALASLASHRSCIRLHAYAQSLVAADLRRVIERHYFVMADQARHERTQPLEVSEIWRRCSVLMIAAESICAVRDELMRTFRCYINYGGVAHDVHDFIDDASRGVCSLPTSWMNEINPDGVFSVPVVKALYDRVRREVLGLEGMARELEIETRFPIMHVFWNESWRTIHDE